MLNILNLFTFTFVNNYNQSVLTEEIEVDNQWHC